MVKINRSWLGETDTPAPLLRQRDYFGATAAPVLVDRTETFGTAPHRHEFAELVFILGGEGRHCADDGREDGLRPGAFFAIRPGASHSYLPGPGVRVANILIAKTFLREQRLALQRIPGFAGLFGPGFAMPRPLSSSELAHCLERVAKMETEHRTREPGWETMQTALLLDLLTLVCRYAGTAGPDPAAVARERLAPALRLMEREFTRNFDLARLAATVNLTPRTLLRQFRIATGMTPHQCLIRIRIGHASQLLAHSGLKVAEVASRCGFRDSNHFSTQFRRLTGLPPRQVRKNAATTAMPGTADVLGCP